MGSQEKCIVKCPFCQTRFLVWLALLNEKRQVRCSHCQNCWVQDPKDCERSTQKETVSSPSLTSRRFLTNNSRKKDELPPVVSLEKKESFHEDEVPDRNKKGKFSFFVFLLPFVLFAVFHKFFVQVFPVLEPVYETFGYSPQGGREIFEIHHTSWQQTVEQEIPTLVVMGELSNISSQLEEAPSLQVVLKGTGACHPSDFASYIFGDEKAEEEDGTCVLDKWSFPLGHDRLLPGQVVSFKTTHPLERHYKVEKVQLRFAK